MYTVQCTLQCTLVIPSYLIGRVAEGKIRESTVERTKRRMGTVCSEESNDLVEETLCTSEELEEGQMLERELAGAKVLLLRYFCLYNI